MVVLVERDDLAVEDRRARPEVEANVTELGKGGREALVIACEGSHPSPVDVDHGAHPVALELVRPSLVARGRALVRNSLVASSCGGSSTCRRPWERERIGPRCAGRAGRPLSRYYATFRCRRSRGPRW